MKPMLKIILVTLLLVPAVSFSQSVINVYARVTAISGTTVTITGSTGTFTSGEAIIMQVQDSTIGSNTGNNAGFGNLGAIQSAGVMEIVNITAASASSITLSAATANIYHVNNNSRVQIISYPTLGGGGNYTTTSALTAAAWNGATGGVLAFKVGGTLTINNNLTAAGLGFRGGAAGANAPGDVTCDPATYYDNAAAVSTIYYGYKGEGIYNSNGIYTVARGKLLNGGGGGNVNNSGGGGGSNLTAGGNGGLGWGCSAATSGGGIGGIDLSTYVSGSRFFLGGGGGGGQQNNAVGTPGGNGGGIILIKANAIQTNTGCNSSTGSVNITANGKAANNSGNDGAGGGGAGGSIILQVASYTVNNACPININSSGGNGGTVNNDGAHGGGAGGGKGVVIMSGVVGTPANVAVSDTAGRGGANANTSGAAMADNGSAVANSGTGGTMFMPSSVLLPVKLSFFQAASVKTTALLQWQSEVENDIDYYEIERSVNNGNSYVTSGRTVAKGNNKLYSYTDNLVAIDLAGARIYYRLKMVNKAGQADYSAVRVVSFAEQANATTIKAFPNPATATVYISSSGITAAASLQAIIHDMQGRVVKTFSRAAIAGLNTISLSLDGVTKGQYIVTINGINGQEHTVITKQ